MRRFGLLLLIILASCGGQNSSNPTITPPAVPTNTGRNTLPERPTIAIGNSTAVPSQATTAPNNQPGQRILSETTPRMQGDDVMYVQQRLVDLGYPQVGDVDGFYGPKTAEAVRSFQELNGLAVNGTVDQATWSRLADPDVVRYQAPVENPPVSSGEALVLLKPDGRTIVKLSLTDYQETAFFAPEMTDQQAISAITADPTGTYVGINLDADLYLLNNTGEILATLNGMSRPIWSPNGKYFAANSVPTGNKYDMVVYPSETNGDTPPLREFPATMAGWNQAGDTLVTVLYLGGESNEIVTINVETGAQTTLLSLPFSGDEAWAISNVQFAPDENFIYFYGGQNKNLGASGNGMQWWAVATQGGSAGCSQKPTGCGEPKALTEPGGNAVDYVQYDAERSKLAYSTGFHNSACSYNQAVEIADGWLLTNLTSPFQKTDFPNDGGVSIHSVTWLPNNRIAFSQAFYTCTETAQVYETPHVFLWDLDDIEAFSDIAEGSFPAWVK